jgi:GT2 family glycosyltransferase
MMTTVKFEDEAAPSIEVIIVTHDDPEALNRCVDSVLRTGTPIQTIRVIDTAGRRAAADELEHHDDRIIIQRLPVNSGPAGGWSAGLTNFLHHDSELAWLLDDDCVVHQEALQRSTEALREADVAQSQMIDSATGRIASTQGWCGVLISRRVVETVGVPNAELVWWAEDTEYIQWRIPRAGFKVVRVEDSVVSVAMRPEGVPKPPWKYYYEARNQLVYRIRTQRPTDQDNPVPRHLTRRVRWLRAARSIGKLAGRSLIVERDARLRKLLMVGMGAYHGARGRTGLVIPLDHADRARTAARKGRT